MIKVFVQKTMAQAVVDTPLTSGSKGVVVEFVFSEDWNGFSKTAVFETSSFYKETAPLTGETIEVPEDVMVWEDETLYIGVYGTAQNGETVLPTVYADCGRIQKGANDTPGGRPLIPAQSDILQNQITDLSGRVEWLESVGGSGGNQTILLDTTLTQPGKAADAKAVGDALENVGGKAYVQDTEPAQMEVGEFWYNPEEEADSFPTTLPNPHKLTFSGAVNAEYDGSEAVEVVIPQGGGGESGVFTRLVQIVLEEEVSSITIDETSAPGIANCKEVLVHLRFTGCEAAVTSGWIRLWMGNASVPVASSLSKSWQTAVWAKVISGRWATSNFASGNNISGIAIAAPGLDYLSPKVDNDGIIAPAYEDYGTLVIRGNNLTLPVGTIIDVWGVV